jgi:drug/metabolite transporter (DMT)-like permease
MKYILFALLAPLLFAIGNIIDNYLVSRYGSDEHDDSGVGGLIMISAFFSFIALVVIAIFKFQEIVALTFASGFVLVLSGILSMCAVIFYLYALEKDDVTNVVVWWQLVPVAVYLIGFVMLKEQLLPEAILGGLLIVAGVIIVNFSKTKDFQLKNIFNSKVFVLMLPAVACFAFTDVLFKFITIQSSSFWVSTFFENIGIFIVGTTLFIFSKTDRRSFFRLISTSGAKILALNFSNETLYTLANLCIRYASLALPVVIVSLLNGLNLIFVFLIGLICTIFFPWISKEDISKKVLVKKILGVSVVIIGLLLL